MSSNKTEHFGLHAWAPEDPFLREEFNENFARLDGAARVTAGSYTGDGRDGRVISLGFTPTAVLVVPAHGCIGYGGYSYGGVMLGSVASVGYQIVENGFRLEHNGEKKQTNNTGVIFFYFALR